MSHYQQPLLPPNVEPGFGLAGAVGCPPARCFCTIGAELWVAERDGALCIRDLARGPQEDAVVCRVYPPDLARANCLLHVCATATVWAGCCDGRVRVYDRQSRELLQTLCAPVGEHEAEVHCLIHNGAAVFTGGADGRVCHFDAATYALVRVLGGHAAAVRALACSDPLLYSGDAAGGLAVWDAHTGRRLSDAVTPHAVGVAALAKVGPYLWCGCSSGAILVYDTSNYVRLQVVQTLAGHRAGLRCLLGLPARVLSGALDRTICVWDAQTFRLVARIPAHEGFVIGLSACSKVETWRVVSVANDKQLRAWDIYCPPELVNVDAKSRADRLEGMCEAALGDVAWLQQKLEETSRFRLQREDELIQLEQRLKLFGEEADERERQAERKYETLLEQHKRLQRDHGDTTAALEAARAEGAQLRLELAHSRQSLECCQREKAGVEAERHAGQVAAASLTQQLAATERSLTELQGLVARLQEEALAKTAQVDGLLRARQASIAECEALLETRQAQIVALTDQLAQAQTIAAAASAAARAPGSLHRHQEALRSAERGGGGLQGFTLPGQPLPLEEVGLFGVPRSGTPRRGDGADDPSDGPSVVYRAVHTAAAGGGYASQTLGFRTAVLAATVGVQTAGAVDASVQAVAARKRKKRKPKAAAAAAREAAPTRGVAPVFATSARATDRLRSRVHRTVTEARASTDG